MEEVTHWIRSPTGFTPADQAAADYLAKFKTGEIVSAEFKRKRNWKFHKKLFSLFGFAFDNWEQPDVETKHGPARKSFDRFRKDLVILAGYYDQEVRIDGSIRVEAKSLKFGKMTQDTFDCVYDDVREVVLKHILKNYTQADIDLVIEQLMAY